MISVQPCLCKPHRELASVMVTDLEKAMGLAMEKGTARGSVMVMDLVMEKEMVTDLVSVLDQRVLLVSRLDHLIPS
ncbi:hypothetical protein D3C87_1679430 [compost metagenome]